METWEWGLEGQRASLRGLCPVCDIIMASGFTSPMKTGVFSSELGQQNSTWGVTPTGWSQTPSTVTSSVEVLLY